MFPSVSSNAIAASVVPLRLASGQAGKRGEDTARRRRARVGVENRVFATDSGSERNEKGSVEVRARVIIVKLF